MHELGLEQVVTFIGFQNGCEVKEALFILEQPSDIHDPHVDLRILGLLLLIAAKELLFRDAFVDFLLDLFDSECCGIRPESHNVSVDR